jgi:GAF domain-containing protein
MNEVEMLRLNAVKRFDRFNFDLNNNFQGLLKIAADIYETPAAFITLIDENNQWFKVTRGFDVLSMPRQGSFCTQTIKQKNTMVVTDTRIDTRFETSPFVIHPPNIRFYAGAPLSTHDRQNIGTLCVMDVTPKEIDDNKKEHLEILSRQVMHLMELELTYKMLNEKMEQIESQNKALMTIAHVQSHQFRGPLCTIVGLMNIIKEDGYKDPKDYLVMMEDAIEKLDEQIHSVVKATELAESSYVTE